MATIGDVARDVGVSPSTVSYALSGKRPISRITRLRIEESIRRLGYRPRVRSVPGSRGSGTDPLALFAPIRSGTDHAVMLQFIAAIGEAARAQGRGLLLFSDEHASADVERALAAQFPGAAIVLDVESADRRVPMLRASGLPTVFIGVPDEADGLHCVDFNFELAGSCAVGHLARLGHREVGLVGSPHLAYKRGLGYARRLLQGFGKGARLVGTQVCWAPCERSRDEVRRCLDALAARLPDLTALIVHNEAALPVILSELSDRGLQVPHDMSVLAIAPQRSMEPAGVTSIAIPVSQICRIAVAMATNQTEPLSEPETRLLAPRIADHGTTRRIVSR